ncbi:MAG: hypothetical protein WCC64_19990 [Aliidongia sp.]
MSITVTLKLATGESLDGVPLVLLSARTPIARATTDGEGKAVFNTDSSSVGDYRVRVDASNPAAA